MRSHQTHTSEPVGTCGASSLLFPRKASGSKRPRTTVEKKLLRPCQEKERRAGDFALFSIQDMFEAKEKIRIRCSRRTCIPTTKRARTAPHARTNDVLLKPASIDGGGRSTEAAYTQRTTERAKARWFPKFEKNKQKRARESILARLPQYHIARLFIVRTVTG